METILRIAAAAVTLALAGCKAGYDMDVRNMTDQPIDARLVSPHADGTDITLRQTRLGPGDRGGMFVQTEERVRVSLRVDFLGNTGYPAILDLNRGLTIVNVKRADTGAKGKLILEQVPRP